ncbi:MAG: serine/threonine-protein kinase [Eubacteriales bacterium]
MEKIRLDEYGRYTDVVWLGGGGTSKVFRAYDTRLHKMVAIKVVKDVTIAMQEAKILRGLEDKRIPYLIDCYSYQEQTVLVMQYIEGMTMTQYFTKYQEVTEREIHHFLWELISILQLLHGQKIPILYLDLKPDNIIIGSDKQLYLIDFGAARYQYYEDSSVSLYGTAGYAPKELIEYEQEKVLDVRSDIYSLGMVAIYMRTGVGEDDIANEMVRKHLREYVISKKFQKVIVKCVQEDKEKRYANIKEVEYHMKQVQLSKYVNQIVVLFTQGLYGIFLLGVAGYVGMVLSQMNLLEIEQYTTEIGRCTILGMVLLLYRIIVIQRFAIRRKPYRQVTHMMLIGKKGVLL